MKIAIIGANGTLAKSIGKYSNENNFSIHVFGRKKPVEYCYNNFTKVDLLARNISPELLLDFKVIFYCAGAGIQSNLKESFDEVLKINLLIPTTLLKDLNFLKYQGFFVSFGSYFEIGENDEDKKFDENQIIKSENKLVNDYSISKKLFTTYINISKFIFKSYHFILPTIYHEDESTHRIIPYIINSLNNGNEIQLTGGNQIRQYIHTSDVVKIIFESLKLNISSGIYNVEGVEEFSIKELARHLFFLKKTDFNENIFGKVKRVDSKMKILKLDGKKLYGKINFKPNCRLSEIINRYE